jgi:O-methyltransferase
MKSLVRKILSQFGLEVKRKDSNRQHAAALYDKYKAYTMIPESYFVENILLAMRFKHVQGCVVECGVWKGGMAAGIAEIFNDRMFYLFDSFEGLPAAKDIDGASAISWQNDVKGELYCDNCTAEMAFAKSAMMMSGAKHLLVKGWFNDTLPIAKFESPIAVLRLDGDWYESTMQCFTSLYPLVVEGGLIIIDDYYAWDGCCKAVHDYLHSIKSASRIYQAKDSIAYIIKKD